MAPYIRSTVVLAIAGYLALGLADARAVEQQPRVFLGIRMAPVTMAERWYQSFPEFAGAVLVSEVWEDSPAEKAGLKPGDFLVAVDGNLVSSPKGVADIVRLSSLGDEFELTIVRAGDIVKVGGRYFAWILEVDQ